MGKITDILKTMEYGPSPEASDAVRGWLASHEQGFGHFIGGHFTAPGDLFEVRDPSTATQIAGVTQGTGADIDAAVAAARAAQPGWAALPGHQRAKYLYALARLTQKRERFLAVLESLDNGKPIRETRDIDIPLVARHFYHHAGWASLIQAEFPNARPVGVCGQIIPWNFPLLMLAWKVAPALACGDAVVLKPAEYTPLTALAFAEICIEAGLPAGVVNIVTGDGATGAMLAAHRQVDKVAFTGSTEVGRLIRRATAGSGKRLSLELGGKSPFIVFDDADLDSAVEGVVDGIFLNQGQVCCAGSRLLVAESVEARFVARLKARMARLTVGAPLDKSTDIGAIVDPSQLRRIQGLVEAGRAEGAEIFQPEMKLPVAGSFYPPTLACRVETANILAREEVFGPVLATMTFRTPDEAVALANNSRYGLAASLWTENVNRAYEIAARLKAGVVWINSTNLFDAGAAFGGYRQSGFGREGGREGLAEYLVLADLPRKEAAGTPARLSAAPGPAPAAPGLDRTPKMYIGGKQARPDGGAVYSVLDPLGKALGQAGFGNRKDIRNAVEAAAKATGWAGATAHNRAQVLYYIAENLSARAAEFAARLAAMTGADGRDEVEASIRRLFFYAGFADKYDGAVRATQKKFVTLAMNEPYGVMGVVCPDEAPLLAFASLIAPAIAMGNAVVAIPSAAHPLAATDFYTVLDASDLPDGVVNIVTGEADALSLTLAEHDGVDALWRAGPKAGEQRLEAASAGNLKPTWMLGEGVDWAQAEGREFLRRACQIKTIWTPYGE
ncbi:MAG TPA: aldehyde dehydrogenase family protein [Roseiarcus sp.]|nr:aldehyde dehydrogenase family protein [Roseiarcus sp.]